MLPDENIDNYATSRIRGCSEDESSSESETDEDDDEEIEEVPTEPSKDRIGFMVRGGEKNADAACQALVQIVEGSSVKDVVRPAQARVSHGGVAARGRGGKENPPGTGRRSRNRRGGKAHRKDKDKAPSGGEKEKKESASKVGRSSAGGAGGDQRAVGVVARRARQLGRGGRETPSTRPLLVLLVAETRRPFPRAHAVPAPLSTSPLGRLGRRAGHRRREFGVAAPLRPRGRRAPATIARVDGAPAANRRARTTTEASDAAPPACNGVIAERMPNRRDVRPRAQ